MLPQRELPWSTLMSLPSWSPPSALTPSLLDPSWYPQEWSSWWEEDWGFSISVIKLHQLLEKLRFSYLFPSNERFRRTFVCTDCIYPADNTVAWRSQHCLGLVWWQKEAGNPAWGQVTLFTQSHKQTALTSSIIQWYNNTCITVMEMSVNSISWDLNLLVQIQFALFSKAALSTAHGVSVNHEFFFLILALRSQPLAFRSLLSVVMIWFTTGLIVWLSASTGTSARSRRVWRMPATLLKRRTETSSRILILSVDFTFHPDSLKRCEFKNHIFTLYCTFLC